MTDPALTDRILPQGKALVRAIEALGTIEPSGPIERAAARVLLYVYKWRLRGVVEVTPAWMTEKILSAGEPVGDRRAMVRRVVHQRLRSRRALRCHDGGE